MRIGLLGGSFDPPHNGHLLAAGDAFEALGLDRLLFVPAAVQPFKVDQAVATPEQRLRMTGLLTDGDERFGVDPVEIDRGGLSYTVETLATLAARWPAPGNTLFWLVGVDAARSFVKWRQPGRIVELATLVVLERADGDMGGVEEGVRGTIEGNAATPRFLATRRIDISSTEIRRRVREGRSIRGFVPEAVADYIAAQRLYR